MAGFAERFVRVLEPIVAEPGLPVGDLDILGVERAESGFGGVERHEPPVGRAGDVGRPVRRCRSRRDPAATAIVFEGESLTYRGVRCSGRTGLRVI